MISVYQYTSYVAIPSPPPSCLTHFDTSGVCLEIRWRIFLHTVKGDLEFDELMASGDMVMPTTVGEAGSWLFVRIHHRSEFRVRERAD